MGCETGRKWAEGRDIERCCRGCETALCCRVWVETPGAQEERPMGFEGRVSKHAARRMRQRLGLTKKAAEREADRAIDAMRVEDTHGALRAYLERDREGHQPGTEYRVTPSAIYVFCNETLVTVFKMPPELGRIAIAAWMKRKGRPEGAGSKCMDEKETSEMMELSKGELAKQRKLRSQHASMRYSMKPHEKRLMAEMAGRAERVDRQVVEQLAAHFGVARKVVVEVLTHHRVDLSALGEATPAEPAKEEPSRPKLGVVKPAPEAKPEPEPEADREWVRRQRSELALERSQLEVRRVELERREKELLAREKAVEAAEEMRDEAKPEAEPAPAAPLERDPEATVVQLHTKGMWMQSLWVREAKIEELRMELDRAMDLIDRLQAEREARPEAEPMPGVGPVIEMGDWYMRRKEEPK